MRKNIVNTVFTVNAQDSAFILEGAGQKTVGEAMAHYPLVKRGVVSIVKLEGWMINGVFSPFKPELYAIRHRRD